MKTRGIVRAAAASGVAEEAGAAYKDLGEVVDVVHRLDLARRVVSLRLIATPEADLDAVKPDVPLREQLDLDSMDMLNFVVALHDATGVDIPETDYPRLTTLDACVDYLDARRK